MAAPNKLDDPQKVVAALKANNGHKKATARALGVTCQALYEYIPKHIRIECEYHIIEQPTVIDTKPIKE